MATLNENTYNTNNAVGSNSAEDASDNARSFDAMVNGSSSDSVQFRLGKVLPTIASMAQSAKEAYQSANEDNKGAYSAGVVYGKFNDVYLYDDNLFGVISTVTLPYTTTQANPNNDPNLMIRGGVTLLKMRTDSASQLGLNYVSDWVSGIAIPANSMTNKSGYWYNGQFYSVGTDTGFTSNDFDTDLSSGKFFVGGGGLLVVANGSTTPRSLGERFADVVNVKDFGAVGDWNATTQTGTDDTNAIQAAFDYAASTGTVRTAGRPIVHFPAGNYLITSTINIRNPGGFHFEMTGEGLKSTTIYGGVGDGNNMFDSNIEFWAVSNLKFIGNKSETATNRCKRIFHCYNYAGAADIDVTFTNCIFIYAEEVCFLIGRGLAQNQCVVGQVLNNLVIESPDPWVQRGSNFTDSVGSGMRKNLEIVEAFKQWGIDFVCIPVTDSKDKELMLNLMQQKLDAIADEIESE